jgi:hypothetical protein
MNGHHVANRGLLLDPVMLSIGNVPVAFRISGPMSLCSWWFTVAVSQSGLQLTFIGDGFLIIGL